VRVSVTSVLRRTPVLVTAGLLALPGTALAAKDHKKQKPPTHAQIAKALHSSKDLWATVNICDTAGHPNAIGIRGSMPGTGEPGEMWMRFQIQYFTVADHAWHPVATGGDSKWVKVGSSRYRVRQTGFTFMFQPPAGGGAWTMRGVVSYQWRVRGKVAFREEKNTGKDHTDAKGGDPAHASARLCVIGPP
jgi:hypothetical protein